MKRTFPLVNPPHKPERVVEMTKSKVRKYIQREQRKPFPDGVHYWDFDCRVGKSAEEAQPAHSAELNPAIEKASAEEWPSIYIEIISKPGIRQGKPKS